MALLFLRFLKMFILLFLSFRRILPATKNLSKVGTLHADKWWDGLLFPATECPEIHWFLLVVNRSWLLIEGFLISALLYSSTRFRTSCGLCWLRATGPLAAAASWHHYLTEIMLHKDQKAVKYHSWKFSDWRPNGMLQIACPSREKFLKCWESLMVSQQELVTRPATYALPCFILWWPLARLTWALFASTIAQSQEACLDCSPWTRTDF